MLKMRNFDFEVIQKGIFLFHAKFIFRSSTKLKKALELSQKLNLRYTKLFTFFIELRNFIPAKISDNVFLTTMTEIILIKVKKCPSL